MEESTTSGLTKSVWLVTASQPRVSTLNSDMTADVCVVGAGIAGLSTAYFLTKSGRSVIVLEDGLVGSGETGRTTGHLSNALDDRYYMLEKWHGNEGARLAAESHTAAIDEIQKIVREENIPCDFERIDGHLFLCPGDTADTLNKELEAAHRAGLNGVSLENFRTSNGLNLGPALRFPQQAQFHSIKYLSGLTAAIQKRGGRIFEKAHVSDVNDGDPCTVKTSAGHTISARSVVVATNTPMSDRVAIHTKQAAYRTYVIGMRIPRGSVPRALYWDTGDPYHYVRLQSIFVENGAASAGEQDLLIVGGEDHKTGQANDMGNRYQNLMEWTRKNFPMATSIEFKWSGQVMEPFDGLAYIGPNPGDRHIYIATGDSGNGLTHGTIAGLLISDLISERPNPYAALYEPSRKSRAIGEYVKENFNIVSQYADHLNGGDVRSPDDIPPGSGAVVQRGLKKVAAYRDDQGQLHECSAICPHLGAVVHWNFGEKTWDCPAHGSRFDKDGHVMNGPANADLEPLRAPTSSPGL